eukprot:TRINITY_DN11234_c0_g1_i2.p1 TRINITY_DN11234_c0_g1~~TRINITY_DN11234_c0_g1_i2.p1  ORF type:complete len:216 (+),score=45.24 TRINITY_DN11234_c0_g1_i2:23-649(+)
MRAIIQRVLNAAVVVDGVEVSSIGKGILVLVGITSTDTKADSSFIARKILSLRLWPSADGKPWNTSVSDNKYEVLLVSQFTLYATLKGNKPDFHKAMEPEKAKSFYEAFVKEVKQNYKSNPNAVQDGVFGAMMQVKLVNDGPVTITLDSPALQSPSPVTKKEERGKKWEKNTGSTKDNSSEKGIEQSTPSESHSPSPLLSPSSSSQSS